MDSRFLSLQLIINQGLSLQNMEQPWDTTLESSLVLSPWTQTSGSPSEYSKYGKYIAICCRLHEQSNIRSQLSSSLLSTHCDMVIWERLRKVGLQAKARYLKIAIESQIEMERDTGIRPFGQPEIGWRKLKRSFIYDGTIPLKIITEQLTRVALLASQQSCDYSFGSSAPNPQLRENEHSQIYCPNIDSLVNQSKKFDLGHKLGYRKFKDKPQLQVLTYLVFIKYLFDCDLHLFLKEEFLIVLYFSDVWQDGLG